MIYFHHNLLNKYIFFKHKKDEQGNYIYDGGVYRYFNGKYAQNIDFGGMIGFVLGGDILDLKNKLYERLKNKFDITPEGDLIQITDNSIEGNNFTFNSTHKRFGKEFLIHHLLFDFS